VGSTLLLSSLAIGQEPKSTPRQKYDALLKEYASASEVWSKKFDGAPGEADPVKRHYEWPAWSFAPRFLRLAEDYPEDSAALDALLWVVALDQNVGENDKALLPLYERALAALAKHHLQDKRVQEFWLINVAHDLSVPAERFLRTVMQAGPTREARGLFRFNSPGDFARWIKEILFKKSGRTSIVPPTARVGIRIAIETASSRSSHSIRWYPPSCSLVSANGPSEMTGLPFFSRTVTALEHRSNFAPVSNRPLALSSRTSFP
jgi:hypothetical protein